MTGLCAYPDGTVVGRRFPCCEWLDSDLIEVFHRWRAYGEKWGFQRTDVMRAFQFREDIKGHIPEGVVWSRISRQYKTRFVNEVFRIYHQSPDGLTHIRHPEIRSAEGNVVWMSSIFENEWPYFRYNKLWFIRCGINFTRFHLHCKSHPIAKAFEFKRSATMLILATVPLGCLAYRFDCLMFTPYLRATIQRVGRQSRTPVET